MLCIYGEVDQSRHNPGPDLPSFHFSQSRPASRQATFSFFGSQSFPLSFWAAYYATPRPAGSRGRHSFSNLLVSFRHSNWKSCLEHMSSSRAKRRTKDKYSHMFPPNLVWAQQEVSTVQNTSWRRVSRQQVCVSSEPWTQWRRDFRKKLK